MADNPLRAELVELIRREMPVQVSASVGNKTVTVYADVEPLVDTLLAHLQLTVEHRVIGVPFGPFYGNPSHLAGMADGGTIERRVISGWKKD